MNLPPKPPRFVLPVAGTKVGSIARPVADGAAKPVTPARFGLRSTTRTLASLARPKLPDGEVG